MKRTVYYKEIKSHAEPIMKLIANMESVVKVESFPGITFSKKDKTIKPIVKVFKIEVMMHSGYCCTETVSRLLSSFRFGSYKWFCKMKGADDKIIFSAELDVISFPSVAELNTELDYKMCILKGS